MNTVYIIAIVVLAAAVGAYFWKRKKKKNTKTVETVTEETEETSTTAVRYEAPIKEGDTVYWYENGVKHEGTVKVLAAGLQVFDADGNVIVDLPTRITKYLGVAETGVVDGSITDDELLGGTGWIIGAKQTLIYDPDGSPNNYNIWYPKFTISGNTISWTFGKDYTRLKINVKFYYGIY